MRLLRVDCNKGKKIDGGFAHHVFESSVVNNKKMINIIASTKFDGILIDSQHIEEFKKNPAQFLKEISNDDEDTSRNSGAGDFSDGGGI